MLDTAYRRELRPVERGTGPILRRSKKSLLNFASNDYLGLASDPRVIDGAIRALRTFGAGTSASSHITGYTTLHDELAQRLAAFVGADSAIVLPTGFTTNLAAITALIGPKDAVFADSLNHASLIDGCRLTGARVRHYRHRDMDRLANLLGRPAPDVRRFILTDTIFSMDGTIAPISQLLGLARTHEATFIADEAHATGVLGPDGAGLCAGNTRSQVDLIHLGTLSKALGAQGGFIAADADVIDQIVNTARAFMFSTALNPAAVGAAMSSLDIVQREAWRRDRLLEHGARLRQGLRKQGWTVLGDEAAPFLAVVLGDEVRTVSAATRLEAAGFCIAAIRPPTVKRGTCRLRISPMATHEPEHIDAVIRAFGDILDLQPRSGQT